jgi:hypothetical protein
MISGLGAMMRRIVERRDDERTRASRESPGAPDTKPASNAGRGQADNDKAS